MSVKPKPVDDRITAFECKHLKDHFDLFYRQRRKWIYYGSTTRDKLKTKWIIVNRNQQK